MPTASNIWLHLFGIFYLVQSVNNFDPTNEHSTYLSFIVLMLLLMFLGSVLYHTFMAACRYYTLQSKLEKLKGICINKNILIHILTYINMQNNTAVRIPAQV